MPLPGPEQSTATDAHEGRVARALLRTPRALLRVPLFYKILLANAVIVLVVAAACGAATHGAPAGGGHGFGALLVTGMLVSLGSNAAILALALSPLRSLQQTAERVNAGDAAARVAPSHLADRDLERLMLTFNRMLDNGEAYRRRLREIAARALNATEEERKRIARELHDGIAQTLTAMRLRLRVARSVADIEVRTALLERIGAELGEATEEIRRIAQGLRPPALDMLGLAPAIESHARTVTEAAGLSLETDIAGVEGLLSADAELALYRIVQEALSNAARHAGARSVRVRLTSSPHSVTAFVEDDGRGFAVEQEMRAGGLGLFGMQERGAYVGATVDIESAPAAGTRVRVSLPVVERTSRYA